MALGELTPELVTIYLVKWLHNLMQITDMRKIRIKLLIIKLPCLILMRISEKDRHSRFKKVHSICSQILFQQNRG